MSEDKFCESCGMPLREKKDFGGGRLDNKYCVYCTDEKGELKPFDVVFAGMQQFAIMNTGVSEEEALKIAKETMAKMPAWAGRKELS